MKVIYVSDSRNNVILEGENYHYLIVKGARTSKEKFVCAFDGELSRLQDGERYTIADLLVRHIQTNGPFYLDPNTTPRSRNPQNRIEEVLYSLYYQKPLNTSELKIKIANRNGIGFTSYNIMPMDEAKLLQNNTVIELTKNNIRSNERGTYVHTNGIFYHGPAISAGGNVVSFNGIVGTCKGMTFFTDYDAGLFSLLQKISTWTVSSRGALQAVVGKDRVPFSTIVWAWHHGIIFDGAESDKAILAAHRYFTSMGLEVDHLTGNKSNNCLYALALVHRSINTSLGDRRNSIKEPFYFYTAYSHEVNKLLVKCGFDDGRQHYERRFVFDLPTSKSDTAYKDCFSAFKEKAKEAGCLTTEPEKDNLLCYWADPCRAGSEGDPHMELLKAPLNSFGKYTDGVFDNILEVKKMCSELYWFAPGMKYEYVATALMALEPLDIAGITDTVFVGIGTAAGEQMQKVVFNELAVEVTRKCNMACAHCMRGDAENIDLSNMDIDSILDQTEAIGRLILTGGEPSLGLKALLHIANGIARRGIPVMRVEIISNGLVYDERLVAIMKRFGEITRLTHEYGYDKSHWGPWCALLGISLDKFHEEKNVCAANYRRYKEALVNHAEVLRISHGNDYINEGRAKSLSGGRDTSFVVNSYMAQRVEVLDIEHKPMCRYYASYTLARSDQKIVCCSLYVTAYGDVYPSWAYSGEYRAKGILLCSVWESIWSAVLEYNAKYDLYPCTYCEDLRIKQQLISMLNQVNAGEETISGARDEVSAEILDEDEARRRQKLFEASRQEADKAGEIERRANHRNYFAIR